MVLMGYSGARGTLIYEKNLTSKISCQTPFKGAQSIELDHAFFILINGMWLGTNGGMCKQKKKNLAVTLECIL